MEIQPIQSFQSTPLLKTFLASARTGSDVSSLARNERSLRFGFISFSFKALLLAGFWIGIEKTGRLINILSFGRYGLKKGEKPQLTIM